MEKTFHSIIEISKAINSVLDIDQLLETIMDAAIQSVGVERGILFLKLPDGTLQPRAARNVEKETVVNAEEISRSIIAEVASSGHYFLSSNIQDDPNIMQRPSVREFKILSVLCVPLVNKDSTIGTIYLDSRKATKVFTERDVEFLQTFANLAAIAISNAHVFEAAKNEARYWKGEASQRHGLENIIHCSEAIGMLCQRTRSVAHTMLSVLITGESGTGKELFARAIHYHSPRHDGRFMPINCSALPEYILESELFGAKKGAYTGSIADTKGLFEEANGGTIFLDEIADMQPTLQAKLLRVLQEGEIRRVGDTHYRYTDVRVISATNKNILEEIRDGRFREDLYYRLCGMELYIPPLRERRDDVVPLAHYFVQRFCDENNLTRKSFTPAALTALQGYSFPGNVRELQNIVRKAVLLSNTQDRIEEIELPKILPLRDDPEDFSEATKQHIVKVLEKVEWNQTRAAELLGLNRTTLQAKMKKLNISRM
ncbi:MAG: sigma 54-interacting transcriptional regulator [Ignavibacteriae bacterium]|nr:sigma 54-interacting transcriptional regulator [Ignavibacteria bacterium]MBI3363839.1 sigma 54-interacting transcriptional regulator [Ignavibacteriota bacterium]